MRQNILPCERKIYLLVLISCVALFVPRDLTSHSKMVILDGRKSLLSLLTPQEKISLLGSTASPGIPRLGIPQYEWWNEALHGVGRSAGVTFDSEAHTGYATSFPQVCTLGPSFNRTLFHALGDAIGLEARAFHNAGKAGLTFWAPDVNIFRDPRWGRGQEVPGEDPYLNGEYGAKFVSGLQWGVGGPDDAISSAWTSERRASPMKGPPRVAACCKAFAVYSLETGRMSFDASVADPRDMADTYLPPFEACIRTGGALGVMCSYTSINGVPSCANPNLLRTLLRDEWNFDGYVTGDCGAVKNVKEKHHYVEDNGKTCQAVLRSGLDLDCGTFLQEHGADAYDDGVITDADIDHALGNLLGVQMRLGYFDPPDLDPWSDVNTGVIGSPRHLALAHEAARQGIVLLKNGDNEGNDVSSTESATSSASPRPLPLSKTTHPRIALLGPNADANVTMQGNYMGVAPFLITVKDGFDELLGYENVAYHKGCNISGGAINDPDDICEAAGTADAVVLVVGLNETLEKEGHDRTTLELPDRQDALINLATSCVTNPDTPIVLVVMAGGPVDLAPYKSNSRVSAILYVGYPGQSGGLALAEVVYGWFSPSGRLTTTVYGNDFVNDVGIKDMGMRPNATSGNPGRTYRFYTGSPVYKFGHGLSYTAFRYTFVDGSRTSLKVIVANVGVRTGADSILLFHAGPNAGLDGEPLKELVGFEKIFLEPGEVRQVDFIVPLKVTSGAEGMHKFLIGPGDDHVFKFEVKDEVRSKEPKQKIIRIN